MITIDDSYQILPDKLRGRKSKFKVKKDGKVSIFKYGAINGEIYAELIAEQLGIQVGIEMAHYELACYGNNVGVLTPSFLNSAEYIISSDSLRKMAREVYNENNIEDNLENNTIVDIVNSAYTLDSRVDTVKLVYELIKRWLFYGLILESDKNETNIGFILNPITGLRLSPDYDNSSMAQLNKNISNFIDALRRGRTIYDITDQVANAFHPHLGVSKAFIDEYREFVVGHEEIVTACLSDFEAIDISQAIAIVEKLNGMEIPWEVKFWVEKCISTRFNDMKRILKESQSSNVK